MFIYLIIIIGMSEIINESLDYSKVYSNILNWIKKYVVENNIKTLVLWLSGWIDSTLTAAICKQVDIPLIWISLPCSTNKSDEISTASQVWKEFCTTFKEVNLQDTFSAVESFCKDSSGLDSTPISQWNIKARLRMITLYDVASKTWWMVVDTDNLTEHFLWFWTIHGDDGDFNPIWWLRKHEVYNLARWVKENIYKDSVALESSIALIPTDGNGVSWSDLDQIAPWKTYDDVDEILQRWVGLDETTKKSAIENDFNHDSIADLCDKHWLESVKRVITRSIKSEFKRRHRPLIIDIHSWDILWKDGN